MTSFPGSPRIQKGAIIGLDPFNPLASVIVFQYNPESLTRTITPKAAEAGQGAARGEALRLKGPPSETVSATIAIDATDQLERGDGLATGNGIYPQLCALEMLIHPKTALVIANEVLALAGVIEVVPPEAPLTLFAWGPKRIVPVRLTSMTITEEAFDAQLNPILARVQLSLTVLTYDDLGLLHPGGALSMAHHVIKEVMATIAGASALG